MFYKIRDFIRRHFIGYRPSDMPCIDYLESKGVEKMKIIDLLNKIANGEESDTITEFEFGGRIWNFFNLQDSEYCLDEWLLNQEIVITKHKEIIEEDKKIEKLLMIDGTANILLTANQTRRKINEIIDKLNKEE